MSYTPIEYQQLIPRIREIVGEAVRPGARVLVVSRGDAELLRFDNRLAWHFPRADDGSYAGYHPDSAAHAIEHLETLLEEGAQYLLVPAPSFWWLQHYPELFEYLARNATVVWEDDACLLYRRDPQAGGVDILGAIDGTALYAQGWLRESGVPVTRLTAVSAEGERIELLGRLFRHHHPDLGRLNGVAPRSYGRDWSDFIVRFEIATPSPLDAGWVFEVEDDTGATLEIPAPPVVRDIAAVREMILERLPSSALPDERLMSDQVFPAVDRLQERAQAFVQIDRIVEYGELPEPPEISIVIPLYSRIDFIEDQMAEFVHDPEARAAELIYVLDSPELGESLGELAGDLFRVYGVPFKVVARERSSGFASANNAGASAARGRLLVLLNSDVLPDRPGWLGKMRSFYDSRDRIGALGAKLLYEDGSLQHAGMYFDLADVGPFAGTWANMHYFKGYSRHLPAANVARPVAAVTAACLMIETDLYRDVGGLTDVYVQGDFEDSDLCLRLLEAGRESWYLPDAELYHLEGQSYDDTQRMKLAFYNRWLHTRRWGELIEAVAARYPSQAALDVR